MYIKREAEKTLKQMSKAFKTILVAGPRQVGKTTLLKNFDKKLNLVNGLSLFIILVVWFLLIY